MTVLEPDWSADSDNASDVSNPYLYTGRRNDAESNLMQYRHRYYSWRLGRFISRDPKGYVDGYNLYEYASGQVVISTDPLGLDCDNPCTRQMKGRTLAYVKDTALKPRTKNEAQPSAMADAFSAFSAIKTIKSVADKLNALKGPVDLLAYEFGKGMPDVTVEQMREYSKNILSDLKSQEGVELVAQIGCYKCKCKKCPADGWFSGEKDKWIWEKEVEARWRACNSGITDNVLGMRLDETNEGKLSLKMSGLGRGDWITVAKRVHEAVKKVCEPKRGHKIGGPAWIYGPLP